MNHRLLAPLVPPSTQAVFARLLIKIKESFPIIIYYTVSTDKNEALVTRMALMSQGSHCWKQIVASCSAE